MLDAVAVLATADTVAAAVEIAVDTVETGESARLARARRLGAACAPSSSETILVDGDCFSAENGGGDQVWKPEIQEWSR